MLKLPRLIAMLALSTIFGCASGPRPVAFDAVRNAGATSLEGSAPVIRIAVSRGPDLSDSINCCGLNCVAKPPLDDLVFEATKAVLAGEKAAAIRVDDDTANIVVMVTHFGYQDGSNEQETEVSGMRIHASLELELSVKGKGGSNYTRKFTVDCERKWGGDPLVRTAYEENPFADPYYVWLYQDTAADVFEKFRNEVAGDPDLTAAIAKIGNQ